MRTLTNVTVHLWCRASSLAWLEGARGERRREKIRREEREDEGDAELTAKSLPLYTIRALRGETKTFRLWKIICVMPCPVSRRETEWRRFRSQRRMKMKFEADIPLRMRFAPSRSHSPFVFVTSAPLWLLPPANLNRTHLSCPLAGGHASCSQ